MHLKTFSSFQLSYIISTKKSSLRIPTFHYRTRRLHEDYTSTYKRKGQECIRQQWKKLPLPCVICFSREDLWRRSPRHTGYHRHHTNLDTQMRARRETAERNKANLYLLRVLKGNRLNDTKETVTHSIERSRHTYAEEDRPRRNKCVEERTAKIQITSQVFER